MKGKKFLWFSILVLAVLGGGFFYFWYYYPFGEGVRTGELNYVVYKGVVFKTWEGKVIQSGFGTSTATRTSGSIRSNEFVFSVADKAIADTLMRMGGREVELRYKEYFGTLPWRGHSKYVVDEVLSVGPARRIEAIPIN